MNWEMRVHRESLLASLGYASGKIPRTERRSIKAHPIPKRFYNRDKNQWEVAVMFAADVEIYPTPDKPRKSSQHRVFIVCPGCGREIPFGRFHQHYGTKACTSVSMKKLR